MRKIIFNALTMCALLICFLPLLPGLAGILLAAIGYNPTIDQYHFSINGFYQLVRWPGFTKSLLITLFVTIASTLLTLLISFAILQSCWQRPYWKNIERLLAPVIALPHVAFAIGLAFLFSNSGLMARVMSTVSNELAFLDWDIVNNQFGLGLILALTLKEIPFILFMSIALLKQLNIADNMRIAQSLGYSPAQTWQKIIFPQWLPKIRFSLLAIMAYSLSVVDVALVIGPSNPPTLPVLLWRWLNDADLQTVPKASAAAALLLILCIALVYLLRFIQWLLVQKQQNWQISGRYSLPMMGKSAIVFIYGITAATLLILIIWSFTQRWSFPQLLPSQWTLFYWQQEWYYLIEIMVTSTIIAVISATIALLLAIVIHEYNTKNRRFTVPLLLIAIPMLAPQLSLLFGIQLATLYIANHYYYFWVIWAHIFFAFPYCYLALDGPWRSYDNRLDNVALSLGMSPLRVWWKIKCAILLPAIAIAWAVAISVSLAQYLPTLMLGAGRITTLTTEAVALASGQDRRISAIYALLQSLLPFLFFIFAIIIGYYSGKIDNQQRRGKRHVIITQ